MKKEPTENQRLRIENEQLRNLMAYIGDKVKNYEEEKEKDPVTAETRLVIGIQVILDTAEDNVKAAVKLGRMIDFRKDI